jgi:HAD superfamily hydrolase (TIGR01509 family)
MLNDGYKAIIFDMDGVITDTEALHRQAEEAACRHYGLDAPRAEWENFQGRTAENIFSYLIGKYGGGRQISVPEIVDFKTRSYLDLVAQDLPVIPGVLEFIKLARRNLDGLALATGSNRAVQRSVFDRYDLHRYFDAVVTGDEVRMAKPDPEAYLKASLKLGKNPAECLVIEDSDNGVRAGVSAGCRVIGITTSFPRATLTELGASIVVDAYDELTRLLDWH